MSIKMEDNFSALEKEKGGSFKMKFKQYDDGSCDIEYTWKERLRILLKGKMFFNSESFKHVVNNFAKIIFEWQANFLEKDKDIISHQNKDKTSDEIKSE